MISRHSSINIILIDLFFLQNSKSIVILKLTSSFSFFIFKFLKKRYFIFTASKHIYISNNIFMNLGIKCIKVKILLREEWLNYFSKKKKNKKLNTIY
jgi:hypothetical protein